MKHFFRKIIFTSLALGTFTMTVPQLAPVVEASIGETLLSGGIAMVYVSTMLNKMDNSEEGQRESLARTQEQTGVDHDYEANARVKRIMANLIQSPKVKRTYSVYVNPSDDFNAFMTVGRVMSVNRGALDKLDDDQLAYVMAHEIAHGEHKDIINGLKKQVGLSTAASIYADRGGGAALLSNVAGNYLSNQVFTMSQESNADKLGFEILADSPYNVGGAAGSMAVLRNAYGDHYREGLASILNPNNHPKTSGRVTSNVKRMKEYSGNHVDVKNSTVYVNNVNIYTPVSSGRYTGEERAYYMAGKLARLYHNNQISGSYASASGANVYVRGESIVSTPDGAVASMVADNLNKAFNTVIDNKGKTVKDIKKAQSNKGRKSISK